MPQLGYYRGPWHPMTSVKADSLTEFKGAGIHFRPVEAMRRWAISYQGKMIKVHGEKEDEVIDSKRFGGKR